LTLGGKKPRPGKLGKLTPPGRALEAKAGKILSAMNLKPQPNSGALPGKKGDLIGRSLESFVVECKETTHKSYDLSLDTLSALVRATKRGSVPVLLLDFKSAGKVRSGGRAVPSQWVILPADDLNAILLATDCE
jgi:hypothetical protein